MCLRHSGKHGDGHGFGRGIEINAAVGRTAVILHLEGEARVRVADCVGRRSEHQQAGIDVADRDKLASGNRDTVVLKTPCAGQRGDLDGQEVVHRTVIGIREAEIAGAEHVGRVLQRGDRAVAATRGLIDPGDVDGHGLRVGIGVVKAIPGAAVVLYPEGEAVSRICPAAGVRHGRVSQLAGL